MALLQQLHHSDLNQPPNWYRDIEVEQEVSHTSSNLRTIIVDLFSLQKRHRHEWNRPSGKEVGKGYVNGLLHG